MPKSGQSPDTLPTPTRTAALARLARFVPLAGRAYTSARNIDRGPGAHEAVSQLSPWLRHRVITEEEVLRAVLLRHSPSSAGKFIEEVFWRGYFKGHLEARPSIWSDYRRAVATLNAQRQRPGPMADGYAAAIAGRTGIDCFDAWTAELLATGYLHNHSRMAYASIWIFTLKLPWQLGADFTYRHFLDGDPASNTLSWRWVAGLHTRGKTYLVRASNITQYSAGRFAPQGLATKAVALEEPTQPALVALPTVATSPPPGKVALLLTEEDLHPESLGFDLSQVLGVAGATAVAARSPLPVATLVQRFTDATMDDALARAQTHFGCRAERLPGLDGDAIAEWAERLGAKLVVTACAPVGPVEEQLADAGDWLGMRRLKLLSLRRVYDSAVWPHATRGFFDMRDRIAGVIDALDLQAERPAQGRLDL
jgi:deoxyribodipyrimidine photo-lyase